MGQGTSVENSSRSPFRPEPHRLKLIRKLGIDAQLGPLPPRIQQEAPDRLESVPMYQLNYSDGGTRRGSMEERLGGGVGGGCSSPSSSSSSAGIGGGYCGTPTQSGSEPAFELNMLDLRSKDDFRVNYLKRLSYANVWIPNARKPPQHQTVIIFDWDDTLLCTSYINLRGDEVLAPHAQRKFDGIMRNGQSLLELAIKLGRVFIITNASEGWVEYSCEKYLPQLLPVVEKVTVISARNRYEAAFPGEYHQWKIQAFLEVQRQLNSQMITNLISVGDSNVEMDAVHVMGNKWGSSPRPPKSSEGSSPAVSAMPAASSSFSSLPSPSGFTHSPSSQLGNLAIQSAFAAQQIQSQQQQQLHPLVQLQHGIHQPQTHPILQNLSFQPQTNPQSQYQPLPEQQSLSRQVDAPPSEQPNPQQQQTSQCSSLQPQQVNFQQQQEVFSSCPQNRQDDLQHILQQRCLYQQPQSQQQSQQYAIYEQNATNRPNVSLEKAFVAATTTTSPLLPLSASFDPHRVITSCCTVAESSSIVSGKLRDLQPPSSLSSSSSLASSNLSSINNTNKNEIVSNSTSAIYDANCPPQTEIRPPSLSNATTPAEKNITSATPFSSHLPPLLSDSLISQVLEASSAVVQFVGERKVEGKTSDTAAPSVTIVPTATPVSQDGGDDDSTISRKSGSEGRGRPQNETAENRAQRLRSNNSPENSGLSCSITNASPSNIVSPEKNSNNDCSNMILCFSLSKSSNLSSASNNNPHRMSLKNNLDLGGSSSNSSCGRRKWKEGPKDHWHQQQQRSKEGKVEVFPSLITSNKVGNEGNDCSSTSESDRLIPLPPSDEYCNRMNSSPISNSNSDRW